MVFLKSRVPINVNYRYKENELIYLLDNADAEAVFFKVVTLKELKQSKINFRK